MTVKTWKALLAGIQTFELWYSRGKSKQGSGKGAIRMKFPLKKKKKKKKKKGGNK